MSYRTFQLQNFFSRLLIFSAAIFLATGPANSGSDRLQAPEVKIADIRFYGICDGSAAVRLDQQTVLVAYDETNTLFAFDIWGGRAVGRVDLAPLLDLATDREMDIEAAVRDGDKIWWIGSHGLDKSAEDQPNRRVLFATTRPDRNLQNINIVAPPVDLTAVLLSDSKIAEILTVEARTLPPKGGGISIEGLARHPAGGLIVAFRSPLSGPGGQTGNALAVHIVNDNGQFRVRKSWLLDLGNRGIRDIVQYGDEFLLIAGPAGSRKADRGNTSVLFKWQQATGTTQQLPVSLSGLNPEALVALNRQWLVLSDDGKKQRPDDSAGDGERKCDKIRKKSGENHPSVYFKAIILAPVPQ